MSNLTRLMRRFAAADGAFAERFADHFAAGKNKHLIVEITHSNCHFDCHIGCQIGCEKAAESKTTDINYQLLNSAEAEIEIAEEIAIENEFNTDQNYPYYYYQVDFEKGDSEARQGHF